MLNKITLIAPKTITTTNYTGLMVSTSTATYTSFLNLSFLIPMAYVTNESKKLMKQKFQI